MDANPCYILETIFLLLDCKKTVYRGECAYVSWAFTFYRVIKKMAPRFLIGKKLIKPIEN